MSEIITERHGNIAVVRMARAEARNALTVAMAAELTAALQQVSQDSSCQVVVLAGDGETFCAGLDLKAVSSADAPPLGAGEWMALQEVFSGLMTQVHKMRQPVIGAIQGAAVGAGLGIALACDVRIATPSTKFLVGAVKLGLSAGECGISYHLPRLVGAGRAFEIMLTGRAVSGTEAQAIGLVIDLMDRDALLDRALDVARAIGTNAPYSVKHTKQVMWANLEANFESALELENHVQVVGLLTEDFAEAAKAFTEKRTPVFQGR
ncbi:enoyl-CoA hydratase/isomerase family protein [Novosphingobium sp. 9U]|uniref:enoyl-CoA hydratase/isomerase family protein n=1 Tax=Novosphingobium sp. 9U TaxID=2653158 RepID=UPI0012F3375C|nr:enoyl-CoA hydratase-related protein [Novosphingobium sp. 9U]VWX54197.1 Enoyl-CoA hydratase [Novosphingobium sp. 9U]